MAAQPYEQHGEAEQHHRRRHHVRLDIRSTASGRRDSPNHRAAVAQANAGHASRRLGASAVATPAVRSGRNGGCAVGCRSGPAAGHGGASRCPLRSRPASGPRQVRGDIPGESEHCCEGAEIDERRERSEVEGTSSVVAAWTTRRRSTRRRPRRRPWPGRERASCSRPAVWSAVNTSVAATGAMRAAAASDGTRVDAGTTECDRRQQHEEGRRPDHRQQGSPSIIGGAVDRAAPDRRRR